MSWRASAYIKALVTCPNGERISRTEKLVALVLADSHQDKGTGCTFPAVKTIAADSLMDPRVCRRILASLEQKGVIERQRAERQGRGQITAYRFPALDGKGGHVVPLLSLQKGDNLTPFLLVERGTEGGRKEDGRRTKRALPPMEEQEQEQERKKHTPLPPQAGAREVSAVERAVDQVCSALDIAENQRRRRGMIAGAVKKACEKGEPEPTVALGMIAAVREQDELYLRRVLKFKYGLEKFIGGGIWRDRNRWGWDPREMHLQAEAKVGSVR